MLGEEYPRCPVRPVLEDGQFIKDCFGHFRWYERGQMPESGTWQDQTEAFLQVVEVIETAKADIDSEDAKMKEAERRKLELSNQARAKTNRR